MSAMMAELPNIVPGARGVVAWNEADGTLKDVWVSEVIASVVDLFFNEHQRYVGSTEPSVEFCASLPQSHVRVWEMLEPDMLERSNTYQEVFLPYRINHMFAMPIRHGGRSIGLVGAYRGPGDRAFNEGEEIALLALAPYVRHAMLSADQGWEMVESEERGVIVCDVHGRILSQSDTARRLLLYAANGRVNAGPGQLEVSVSMLPRALAPLITAFARLMRGEPAGPPRMTIRNAWGDFEITAQSLKGEVTPEQALDPMCLMISRKQPLPLRVVTRLRDQPLSDRQKQVALHLALDRSVDQIVDRMGISTHTYRDHVRAVYAGLGVANRAQLLGRLIG